MADLNESNHVFANITAQVFHSPHFCSGSLTTKTLEIATYLILIAFSLMGNLLVVAVFSRNKTLRTAVHYFIVNMAVSDLIIPVITLPWGISYTYFDGFWLVDGVLGNVLCKVISIAWPVSNMVSILSMIAIAADRFRSVLLPMKSALFRNKRRLIIASTWVASLGLQAPFLYAVKVVPRHDSGLYCTLQWDLTSHTQKVILIAWVLTFFLTSLSAIVLTVLYSSIIISLHRQKFKLHLTSEMIRKRESRNRKIAYMLVTIVAVFYVVWIPFHVERYHYYLKPHTRFPCFFHWIVFRLPFLYPVINPAVYYMFNKEYRQGFRELLRCLRACANKCNECLRPSVPPQGVNNAHSDDVMGNLEFQAQ